MYEAFWHCAAKMWTFSVSLAIFLANTGCDKEYTLKFSANADKWFSLLHFDHEMEEAETERVEDNSSLIELDIFWWKLKRKVVKINIFTFLQMSEARHLFIWNKGYNFTRHLTIKAYQAFISKDMAVVCVLGTGIPCLQGKCKMCSLLSNISMESIRFFQNLFLYSTEKLILW